MYITCTCKKGHLLLQSAILGRLRSAPFVITEWAKNLSSSKWHACAIVSSAYRNFKAFKLVKEKTCLCPGVFVRAILFWAAITYY